MKVLCAMSGGLDSTAAAMLLKDRGHEVEGVYMRIEGCSEAKDSRDAATAARKIGIPFHEIDLTMQFRAVVDYFIREYNLGRTPNPCAFCNMEIKFGALLGRALDSGFDKLATGHHARVEERGGRLFLATPKDRKKDQTYFLFALRSRTLSNILFPCGDYTKDELAVMVRKRGLDAAERPESQETCFTGGLQPGDFIASREPDRLVKGPVVKTSGENVGTHRGIQRYTVGQRKGLGIAFGKPVYVVALDAKTNTVVVGDRADLDSRIVKASHVNWWVDPNEIEFPLRAESMIRYNMPPASCEVDLSSEGQFEVRFDAPVRGVTPGQALVAYRDGLLIAGGWIEKNAGK